jgi:hypothetical protein
VRSTFSIAAILGWTTVAALILMWIKFLTWKGIAPQTAYSHMTPTQALIEHFRENVPSLMITSAAIFLVMWGWSGRWWQPLVALAGAAFGQFRPQNPTRFSNGDGDAAKQRLGGPAIEHWSYCRAKCHSMHFVWHASYRRTAPPISSRARVSR